MHACMHSCYSCITLSMHVHRCVWILTLWRKAGEADSAPRSIEMTDYGWMKVNDELEIQWETEGNIKKVECLIDFLTKGCKCKTGCTTRRCRCNKGGTRCGPSCQCVNCRNCESEVEESDEVQNEIMDESDNEYDMEEEKDDSAGAEDEHINQLMVDIFGSDNEATLEEEESSDESITSEDEDI